MHITCVLLLRELLWHFFLCRTHNDRAKGGTHRSKRNPISIDWVIYWLFIYWNISFIHKWSYGTRVDFTNIKGTPNVLNSSHVTYVDVRDYVSDSILIFFIQYLVKPVQQGHISDSVFANFLLINFFLPHADFSLFQKVHFSFVPTAVYRNWFPTNCKCRNIYSCQFVITCSFRMICGCNACSKCLLTWAYFPFYQCIEFHRLVTEFVVPFYSYRIHFTRFEIAHRHWFIHNERHTVCHGFCCW